MLKEDCPVPIKRTKLVNKSSNAMSVSSQIFHDDDSDNVDNDELNLSKSFNVDYADLMQEHLVEFCKDVSNNKSNDNSLNELKEELDRFLKYSETSSRKNSLTKELLCRCDLHLEKLTQLNNKSKYYCVNWQNLLDKVTREDSTNDANNSSTDQTTEPYSSAINLTIIKSDIQDDISDLEIWINETSRKLIVAVETDNQNIFMDTINTVLNDIKIHSSITNSICKLIQIIKKISTSNIDDEAILLETITQKFMATEHQMKLMWIYVLELEQNSLHTNHHANYSYISDSAQAQCSRPLTLPLLSSQLLHMGDESGFETELSPYCYGGRRRPMVPYPWQHNSRRLCYTVSSSDDNIIQRSTEKSSTEELWPNDTNSTHSSNQLNLSLESSDNNNLTNNSSLTTTTNQTHMPQMLMKSLDKLPPVRQRKKRRYYYQQQQQRMLAGEYLNVSNGSTTGSSNADSNTDLFTEDYTSRTGLKRKQNRLRSSDDTCYSYLTYPTCRRNRSRMNYSEIARAADNWVQRNSIFYRRSNAATQYDNLSACSPEMPDRTMGDCYLSEETPKESEMDDDYDECPGPCRGDAIDGNCDANANEDELRDTTQQDCSIDQITRKQLEIDVQKHWDYYEAPMYSTSDGDSEIMDFKEIREWDHEFEDGNLVLIDELLTGADDIKLMTGHPINSCTTNNADTDDVQILEDYRRLMTSGYETSQESNIDNSTNQPIRSSTVDISQSLLANILHSSSNQYQDVVTVHSRVTAALDNSVEKDSKNDWMIVTQKHSAVIQSNLQLLINIIAKYDKWASNTSAADSQLRRQLAELIDQWKCAELKSQDLIGRLIKMSSSTTANYHQALLLCEKSNRLLSSARICSSSTKLEFHIDQMKTCLKDIQNIQDVIPLNAFPEEIQLNNIIEKLVEMIDQCLSDLSIVEHCQSLLNSANKSHLSSLVMTNNASAHTDVTNNRLDQLTQLANQLTAANSKLDQLHSTKLRHKLQQKFQSIIDLIQQRVQSLSNNKTDTANHRSLLHLSRLPMKFGLLLAAIMLGWYYKHLVFDEFVCHGNSYTNRSFLWRVCYHSNRIDPH